MNIGILGLWWSRNYGAVLTSFALYKFTFSSNLNTAVLLAPIDKMNSNLFTDFLEKEKVRFRFYPKYLLHKLDGKIDTFIVGSDMMFNLSSMLETHLLNFISTPHNLISYATSMNTYYEPKCERRKKNIERLLKRFSSISFRENQIVSFFKRHYNCNGMWNVDPVFLLSRDEWSNVAEKSHLEKKEYIAAYVLDPNHEIKEKLVECAKEKSFPLRIIVDIQNQSVNNAVKLGLSDVISNASIYDWIKNIRDSKFFVTDSYHGVCFALIFNIPFICIKNSSRGCERFDSLASLLVSENEEPLLLSTPTLLSKTDSNWDEINVRLSKLIKRSGLWLLESIKKGCSDTARINFELYKDVVKKPSSIEYIVGFLRTIKRTVVRCMK